MTTYYVSAQAANGIPAGDDVAGDGSAARPWASIDRANAAARDGDTVLLNDGDYAPARDLRITNAVSWQGVTDYGARILAAPGETRAVTIGEDRGGTVTIGKIVIDGGNAAISNIVLGDMNVPYGLTLDGTRLVNATRFGVQGSTTGTRVNLSMTGVNFTGPTADSMVYLPALAEGEVVIRGGRVDLPGQDQAGYGGIASIDASAPGPRVSISGVTASINATGGDGIHYGIRLRDVASPLIEYNDITQTGSGPGFIGNTVVVSYDRVDGFDSSKGVIRFNTLRDYLPGGAGKLILVGADSDPGAGLRNAANAFEIYGNSGYGNAASQATTLHGILVGWQTDAKVYANSMDFTALAYVLKGMQGQTLVYDNLDTRTTGKSYYQKGGADVQFVHNASYQAAGYQPAMVVIGDIGVGEYPAQGARIVNNSLVYAGNAGSFLAVAPGSSAAQISGNSYYAAGTLGAAAWLYQGAVYTTFADWRGLEADARKPAVDKVVAPGGFIGVQWLGGQSVVESGPIDGVRTYTVSFVRGRASTTRFALANLADPATPALSGRLIATAADLPIATKVLTGSGVKSALFGPLAGTAQAQFSVAYDGSTAVTGERVRIVGAEGQAVNILYRTVELAPPAIAGLGPKAALDTQTVAPFAGLTLTETDQAWTQKVRVSILNPGTGRFTALAGFADLGGGEYAFSGTAAAAVAALRGLRFTPVENLAAPGQAVQTRFRITYDDGGYVLADESAVLTAAGVNDAPVLGLAAAEATIRDTGSVAPFAGAVLADPDPGQLQTVTVAFDKPDRGRFGNLGGFLDRGDGSYVFTGTAAEAQAALRGLVYLPGPNQVAEGDSFRARLTVATTDGIATSRTAVAYVTVQGVNDAPLLTGTAAASITDRQSVRPFIGLSLADPDKGAVVTVTLRPDDPAKGSLGALGGFVQQADGSYVFTGAPVLAQTALRGLVFTPTAGRLGYGGSETAGFSLTVSDGLASVTNVATRVTVASTRANTPPSLAGLPASASMTERQVLQPFAGVRVLDPDAGQTETVTVAFDKPGRGMLGNLAGFVDNGNASYTFTGSAEAASAALAGLTFTPAQYQAAPGSSVAVKLTVSVADGVAPLQSAAEVIAVQAVNTAPTLLGTGSSAISDRQVVKPFAAATLADPDKGAAETVTVRLDDPAKGSFTGLAGFVSQADGGYSFTGSPGAAQAALRALVFQPTAGRLGAGTAEAARFSVTVSDGMAAAFDDATRVLVTGTGQAARTA